MNDIKDLEKTLWAAADKLRSNMDAAEYKHVVLGLIFLKYISDAFNDLHSKLTKGEGEFEGADPEDADEYVAYNVFFVPETARWKYLQDRAKQPEIGKLIDNAMDEIEKINSNLKGVLPKIYADPELNKTRLGELIDLIGTIGFNQEGHEAKDLLGRVYEYFLGQFADAEGKKGGQFYTPASIVKLLVEMLEPYEGRVYDGACGSGGMFVQSEKFVKEHQGNIKNLSIYGQESNPTTLRLAKMNLAIRGIDAKIELGDSFLNDRHKDLKADYVIANPPFNISDWSGDQLRDDVRWKYGVPPTNNANFAWIQHFLHHLSNNGKAGIVLANGALSSDTGGEDEIRKRIVEANLVDCIVMLPSQLFYNTSISACLWFLRKNKKTGNILFIDASNLGSLVTRRNRELSDLEIESITKTYKHWCKGENYEDVLGFCKSAEIAEVIKNNYILTPGRYVGTIKKNESEISFSEKVKIINQTLIQETKQDEIIDQQLKNKLAFYYPELDWASVNFSSIDILKTLAATIFKQWFVEFEFPVDNNKTYKSNGGKFKNSDLGNIPEDWEVLRLEDFVSKSNTGADAITKAPIVSENTGIKCARIGDLSNDREFLEWGYSKVEDKIFKQYQLKQYDILVTRTSILGLNKIIMEDLDAVYNNGLIKITIKNDFRPEYVYASFQDSRFRDYINRITNETSTRPNMKINYLLDYPLLRIPKDLENEFSDIYQLLLQKHYLHKKQYQNLLEGLNEVVTSNILDGE